MLQKCLLTKKLQLPTPSDHLELRFQPHFGSITIKVYHNCYKTHVYFCSSSVCLLMLFNFIFLSFSFLPRPLHFCTSLPGTASFWLRLYVSLCACYVACVIIIETMCIAHVQCLLTVHVCIVHSQSYFITFGIFLVSYPGPLKPILYDHIVLRLHSHTHTLAVLISICWPSPVMAHFYRMRDRWGLHSDVLTWGSNLSVKTRVCVREIAFWCVYIVNKAPTHQVSINNVLF